MKNGGTVEDKHVTDITFDLHDALIGIKMFHFGTIRHLCIDGSLLGILFTR